MDTSEVAAKLGTTPRVLRAFLRSDYSTFRAVGSGARYDFTAREMPVMQKRFNEWKGDGKPRPESKPKARSVVVKPKDEQFKRDREVWAEESQPIVMEDIRDPRVRARVRRDAEAAEGRLTTMLVAKGMHVAQGWTPRRVR